MKIHTDSPSNPLVLVVSRVNETGAASFTFDPPRISPTPHARYPVQSYTLVPLRTALTRHYQGEALIDSTRIAGLSSSHRITRAGARSLFTFAPRKHTTIEIPVLYFDFDNGAHCRWTAEQAARFGAQLDDILWRHDLTVGGAWYTTRGGWRFVQPLASPVVLTSDADIELHEARLRAYGAQLDEIVESGFADFDLDGLPFAKQHDPSCDTWSHLFRAPHATRDGVLQQLPMSMDRLRAWDGYASLTPLYAPGESPEEIAAARSAAEVRAAEQRALRAQREAARAANPRAILSPSLRPKGADWNSIDLIEFFRARGDLREQDGDKYRVVCPWNDQHTTGEAGDGGTVIFTGGSRRHTFHCSHLHCAGRGVPALRNLDPHAYDAACREQWIPTGDSPAFAARKAAEAAENARIVANFRRRSPNTVVDAIAAASSATMSQASSATSAPDPIPAKPDSTLESIRGRKVRGYIASKRDMVQALMPIDPKRAAYCNSCGDVRKGFRVMQSPKREGPYRAPYSCKVTWTCQNCAVFFADRRAKALCAFAEANPRVHFAGVAWVLTADTIAGAIEGGSKAAAAAMRMFRGTPACRFLCLNSSRMAAAGNGSSTVAIQFLFAIPRQRAERVALYAEIRGFAASYGMGLTCADDKAPVFVPRKSLATFVDSCAGNIPTWAYFPEILREAIPAMASRKLYRSNKAFQALEPDEVFDDATLVERGIDLDLVEKLAEREAGEAYLALLGFTETVKRAIAEHSKVPAVIYRGERRVADYELDLLRGRLEAQWLAFKGRCLRMSQPNTGVQLAI